MPEVYTPFPVGIRCLYIQELTHRGWECRSWIGEIQKVERERRRVSRGRERVAKEHEKGAERRGRDGWKIGERSTEGENENG